MLNSHVDSKFNVKILSSNNQSYLQIKLPEAKFIFLTIYWEIYYLEQYKIRGLILLCF